MDFITGFLNELRAQGVKSFKLELTFGDGCTETSKTLVEDFTEAATTNDQTSANPIMEIPSEMTEEF